MVDERRVSGRPGAEGAPLWRLVWLVPFVEVLEVLEVVVGWDEGGAMRRDCTKGWMRWLGGLSC